MAEEKSSRREERKPTIDELERVLKGEKEIPLEILPSGEIVALPVVDEEALARFNKELRRATLRLEMVSAAAEDLVARLNAVAKVEGGG